MSRDLVQQKQLESSIGRMAKDIDLEAEHDPAVSRRASNAALRREAVQMRAAAAAAKEPALEAAAQGVQSPSTALPHADAIQRSFGAHDVSGIKAHVGDGSAAAMGAQAYATGDHVVFDKEPDLHTAAHEAAHVVQQAQGVNLYGGVGKAGDSYEQNADAVADRVVQGKSAEDLLGAPAQAGAQQGAVQAKAAPSQAHADGAVIHAIQAHVKLTAARMHAGAAKIIDLLATPSTTEAGNAPMMQMIEAQISLVNGDLEGLYLEIMRVPDVVRATLTPELGAVYGAFHESWARALNRVYSFTHDANDKENADSLGAMATVTTSRRKMDDVFSIMGREEKDLPAVMAPRLTGKEPAKEQRDDELKAAEMEALKSGMTSVEASLELINADLHSSVADQSKQARDLKVSVKLLVNVLEPINPAHIGKIAKLPILVHKVRKLQAEVIQLKGANEDKGLAASIGHDAELSHGLHRIEAKLDSIKSAHKDAKRHHR